MEGIYSTVVLWDILQRGSGIDQGALQKIILFLCSNIGSITSPNSIGNMLLGYWDAERWHIPENIVFLELIRRDYRVYIGKVGGVEVDFAAEKPGEKLYIQVFMHTSFETSLL